MKKVTLTKKGMRTLLFNTLAELIDTPVAAKNITVGNRYKLADAASDVVNAKLKKLFKEK